MTDSLFSQKLNVLFVEDDVSFRSDTGRLMRKRFPNICIDEASNSKDGKRLLRESSVYDVVIRDLQLESNGGFSIPDSSYIRVALPIEALSKGAVVLVFLTGYVEDDILTPLKDTVKDNPDLQIRFVSKRDTDHAFQLEEILRQGVVEKVLGRLLDDPQFVAMRNQESVLYHRNAKGAEYTINIPAFVQAALKHWHLLLPHRKEQMLETFRDTPWEIRTKDANQAELKNPKTKTGFLESEQLSKLVAGRHARGG